MSLSIQIKVDPGNSVAAARQVEDALHRVEDQGKSVGAPATASLKQMSNEAAKTSSSFDSLAKTMKQGLAFTGISVGAQQLIGIADGYTQIQNRLRVMTGDQGRANELFAKLGGIAQRTRSDLTATVDAFAGMSRATKALGLTQTQTLRVTENLNKLVTISGKSAEESAAGLMQFSQALSSGRLQGDELRSVFENMPSLVDALMASTGRTQAGLREMGEQGLITSAVMVKALQEVGTTADAQLGQTIPTIGQSITMLKNEIVTGLGPALQAIAQDLTGVAGSIGPVVSTIGSLIGVMRDVGKVLDLVNPLGWGKRALEFLNDNTVLFDSIVDGYKRVDEVEQQYAARRGALVMAMMEGADAVKRWHMEQAELNLQLTLGAAAAEAFHRAIDGREAISSVASMMKKGGGAAGGASKSSLVGGINGIVEGGADGTKIKAATKEVDEYAKTLESVIGPQRDAVAQLGILGNLYMNGAINLDQYNRATEKHLQLLSELGLIQAKSVTAGVMGSPVDFTAGIDTGAFNGQAGVDFTATLENLKLARQGITEAQTSIADEAKAKAQETREAWASGLGSIAGSFIDAAMAGKQSFSEMAQQMARDIAMLILKMAALKAIQGGGGGAVAGQFLTGLLGGANGFDYTANSARMQLPGFATGGSFTVGGAGGVDSKVAAFRVTPGESVHVRTPQQTMAEAAYIRELRMGAGGQQAPQITVIPPPQDPGEVHEAMAGNGGDRVHARWERKYKRRRLGA